MDIHNIRSVTLLLSYNCNVVCEHCEYLCSPQRQDAVDHHMVRRILDKVICLKGLRDLVLSGGEPFIRPRLLASACEHAASRGLPATTIVTNGFWGARPRCFRNVLKRLVSFGLQRLVFSADAFHVGPGKVSETDFTEAIRIACEQDGLDIEIAPIYVRKLSPESPHPYDGLTHALVARLTSAFGSRVRLESYPVRLHGRAARSLSEYATKELGYSVCPGIYGADPPEYRATFENPTELVVTPEEQVWLCSGIIVGDIRRESLEVVLGRYKWDKHPITRVLTEHGPCGLIPMLTPAERLTLPPVFASPCHQCYLVRRVLMWRMQDVLGPMRYYYSDAELSHIPVAASS